MSKYRVNVLSNSTDNGLIRFIDGYQRMVEADYIEISENSIVFYEDGEIDILDRPKRIIAIYPTNCTLVTKEE